MSTLGTTTPRAVPVDWAQLLRSRWVWCIGAVLFFAVRELSSGFSGLLTSLGDTDDATRLYEVRALLAGTSWFDMSLPRLGGATPLISHWSRLIDLPLALLLSAFGLVMSATAAELATRIVWPLLVLFALLRVLVREADAHGGGTAAWLMLFLGLTCMTGLFQFRVGRIDHHNAMIFGSIAGLLVLVRARIAPQEGTLAGMLIGIGLAVGYEPLAMLLPAIGGAVLLAVLDVRWLEGVRRMAVALAATLGIVFVATVAPSLWFSARCDALSLNMVLLAGAGAVGLMAVDCYGGDWHWSRRVGILAAAGAIGVALYGALDTRCLAGPFGQVDPAIKPIWLDHVIETTSVFSFFTLSPAAIVSFLILMAVGIIAASERWRRLKTPETFALLALMALAAPPAMWMVKLTPYASWVAVFCIVLSITDFPGTESISKLTAHLLGALVLNQWTFAMVAVPVLMVAHVSDAALKGDVTVDGTACMTTPAINALAPLPKGLFVGSVDFGSYIVALTHHDALAAPYHRIDRALIANQAILAAEPAAAHDLLRKVGADYLVLCMPKTTGTVFAAGGPIDMPAAGLEARLKAGQSMEFLDLLTLPGAVPEMRVWKVN